MNSMHRAYWPILLVVILAAAALRLPGVHWLTDAGNYAGFSFHPDDRRFIRAAGDFRDASRRDGYVVGMATHLYVSSKILNRIFDKKWDLSVLLRLISLTYGVLTIALLAIIVRSWAYPSNVALLSAALLAVSPLHVINSHFGTADVVTIFYFYLCLFLGWYYLKTKNQNIFIAFTLSAGACLAMKFFVSVIAPLLVIILLEKNSRKLNTILVTILGVVTGFSVFSFFNYTPWDFIALLKMLAFDNLWIVDGFSSGEQIRMYLWETMPSLGLGTWIFFAIGTAALAYNSISSVRSGIAQSGLAATGKMLATSPAIVYWSAFAMHAFLMLSAEVHAIRHLLVFIPLACFVAAYGFWVVAGKLKLPAIASSILLGLLLAYQTYNALNYEKLYTNDIRNDLVSWLKENTRPNDTVGTFSEYSEVKGSKYKGGGFEGFQNTGGASPQEMLANFTYFITCNLEYSRYLNNKDVENIFHAYGGQERLDFFRDLFSDRLDYKVVYDRVREPDTLELGLADKGILPELGTFTPDRCLIFKRSEANPHESQDKHG